jgi:hypothetical protein
MLYHESGSLGSIGTGDSKSRLSLDHNPERRNFSKNQPGGWNRNFQEPDSFQDQPIRLNQVQPTEKTPWLAFLRATRAQKKSPNH